jgi:hypothetical protein
MARLSIQALPAKHLARRNAIWRVFNNPQHLP